MTYVSKKEKVFDLPEQDETSTSSVMNSEPRLKRFPSVSDRRAWSSEESQRYSHLYSLVSGSESNISKSSSFKYIPFDVLLAILMAEKDAYIQELLLERQEDNKSSFTEKADVLYKADGYEDSDDDREALIRKDAEVVSLKNKIASLESELEDYRETLTKAMHKLETMDSVLNENNLLRQKIKYSEETIRCLEEKKEALEKELKYFKSKHPEEFLKERQNNTFGLPIDSGDCEEVFHLSSERDILLQQVENLQKELERAKLNTAEAEVLRKISETTASSLEELSKENESYKKKLESMKYLEKQIEDLKKQAYILTDKYKKESKKATEQLKQIHLNTKELQFLREEKNKLEERVNELLRYESQFLSLQTKLHKVEAIIDENEFLNKKLIQLDRLEVENELLRKKIDQLKSEGSQAIEDKEKILNLQCAVVDQEEEIRKMLRQIEDLSQGYVDKNEIYQMRSELEEKNGKLKKYEKQLAEIPILESEVDELKNKLQKCIDDFKSDKNLLQRLQEELEACRKRCHELEELAPLYPPAMKKTLIYNNNNDGNIQATDRGENTEEVLKLNAESQYNINNFKDKSTEVNLNALALKEIEEHNKTLRNEVESLKQKLSEIDLDYFIFQTEELKSVLTEKENKIVKLQIEIADYQEKLKILTDENEIRILKQENSKLEKELMIQTKIITEAKNLENCLEKEKKARNFAAMVIKELEEKLEEEKIQRNRGELLRKLNKEEANVARQQLYIGFTEELNEFKNHIAVLKNLSSDLKTENKILIEMKEFSDTKEKPALKGKIKKMKAEIKVLKTLSKPELDAECEFLKEKIRSLLTETDTLIKGISNVKSTLESEKMEKEYLVKEFENFKSELSACATAGSEILKTELAKKDFAIENLQKELEQAKSNLELFSNEAYSLREENTNLMAKYNELKIQYENAESHFRLKVEELLSKIESLEECRAKNIKKIEVLEDGSVKDTERIKILEENVVRDAEKIKHLEDTRLMDAQKIKAMEEARLQDVEKIKNLEENLTKGIEKIQCTYVEKSEVSESNLSEKLKELEELVRAKDEELQKITEKYSDVKTELEELVRAKDEELQKITEKYSDVKTELYKVNSELDDIKSKLLETDAYASSMSYEENLKQKLALEEASKKISADFEELKVKLEECESIEGEMQTFKNKRKTLLEKMTNFERQIEVLEAKLKEFDNLQTELEQLKAEKEFYKLKDEFSPSLTEILQELELQKARKEELEIENENLRAELLKSENLLEVRTTLQNTIPESHCNFANEFFTPPAVPSPRSPGATEYANELMSVDVHRKEIVELENSYKEKILKLKECNTEKIKKIITQNENKIKCQSKAFHDSINGIKSSYETNIRKLVEKHKTSILRLQDLHEDEVQELNKNYETQMEAMQTQNENLINDLRTESAKKYKDLMEQYNLEIKNWEGKYDELLKAKEEITKRRSHRSQKGLENIHRSLDKLTQNCSVDAIELEEKHAKELKRCKKNNLKRIEVMKNKYEALLEEERKKYEEQLEEVLLKLKNGRPELNTLTPELIFQQKKIITSNPCLEFLEILQKIINEGLESLTLDELVVVHTKTCFIPSMVEEGGGAGEDVIGTEGCSHRVLMMADREELLRKIFTLEREMVIKQLETHEAIVNMENAEKYQIEELKNALYEAQEKNLELKQAMSNQSKLQTDLQIERYVLDKQASLHENSALEKVKELEREKAERKRLEEDLEKERANVKHLTASLELEKEWYKNRRKRDCEYVESIRQRLEEALNHEQAMESQLDYETRFRAKMEAELQALQKTFNLIVDSPSHQLLSESKVVKDIKNLDQCEVTKEERRIKNKSKFKK